MGTFWHHVQSRVPSIRGRVEIALCCGALRFGAAGDKEDCDVQAACLFEYLETRPIAGSRPS